MQVQDHRQWPVGGGLLVFTARRGSRVMVLWLDVLYRSGDYFALAMNYSAAGAP
jgi:hypothetical protein